MVFQFPCTTALHARLRKVVVAVAPQVHGNGHAVFVKALRAETFVPRFPPPLQVSYQVANSPQP